MNIIAVDDEKPSLESLVASLKKVIPEAKVIAFRKPEEALEFANSNVCDAAFVDIQMKGMTGIQLAKRLQDVNPKINIIFSTGYSDYMRDAFEISASGYLLKPITPLKVQEAIANLRYPLT